MNAMHLQLALEISFPKTAKRAESRIVDEQFQSRLIGETRGKHRAVSGDVQIGRDDFGIRIELCGQLSEFVVPAGDENQIVAFGRKLPCEGSADAG